MFRGNSAWRENKHFRKKNLNVDNIWKNHEEFIKSSKLILKAQQRFKSEKHNVFTLTKEINKTVLTSNDDKGIQSMNSIETYSYVKIKDLVCKQEEVKYNNIIKQHKND